MFSVVHSIQVSLGGVPKLPVPKAMVTVRGLEGDNQRNKRYHGGPSRAVCLYSLDLIRELQFEGHPIEPGSVGENLTLAGVDWSEVVPGVRLEIGAVDLQVMSFTRPCKTIRKSFVDNNIWRIGQERFPGWSRVYGKVLREGVVEVGDPVRITQGRIETSANLDLF